MTTNNEYKDYVAGVFDRASASYDLMGARPFTYFGKGLVDFAQIHPGSRVLDVACGRGAVLLPALKTTGESGEVLGIDLSQDMVTLLKEDLTGTGTTNANALVMDAEDLQFPDQSFEVVLCGLSLFFFPNLGTALKEYLRVLKPGGFLAVSTLVRIDTPWADRLLKATKPYLARLAAAPTADTKDLEREEEVTEALTAAGFVDIRHTVGTKLFHYKDEIQWWEVQWTIFRRGFLERLNPDALEGYRREALSIVREFQTEEGLPMTASVRYSRSKRPGK